ncbi:MAG: hypothetical protein RLZZ215_3354 [Pseudomonadota bacterium]|jgi:hypothetical protein
MQHKIKINLAFVCIATRCRELGQSSVISQIHSSVQVLDWSLEHSQELTLICYELMQQRQAMGCDDTLIL